MKSTATATMALLMHLATAANLAEHQPVNTELAEQAADWDELHDDLYNVVDEDVEFDEAIDDLEAIWRRTVDQLEYYMSLDIAFNNFLGVWQDMGGDLASGNASLKFCDGERITIKVDGTWSDSAGNSGTAWWNGRNEINIWGD